MFLIRMLTVRWLVYHSRASRDADAALRDLETYVDRWERRTGLAPVPGWRVPDFAATHSAPAQGPFPTR